MMLDGAQSVIIVPGYGMAVAQEAQHAVKNSPTYLLTDRFETEVRYAHPSGGRAHARSHERALAEASVPYEQLIEMEEINSEFGTCDVALVIGADDTVNPAAEPGEEPLKTGLRPRRRHGTHGCHHQA